MFRILLICFMLMPAYTLAGCHTNSTVAKIGTQTKKEPVVVLYSAEFLIVQGLGEQAAFCRGCFPGNISMPHF